jgi:hypothetical protein
MSHNEIVYSTYRPTVVNAFNEYRRIKSIWGWRTNTARGLWNKFCEECEKFHLNCVEEYEKQLEKL